MQKDLLRQLIFPVTASGDNTIIAAAQLGVGIGSIKVYQIELETAGAVTITPKSGSTIIPGVITLTGAGAAVVLQATGEPWWRCLPGQALVLNMSTNALVTGALYYALA
jgi:hypothetical protein